LIIAGIDPGSLNTGYCFLEENQRKVRVLEYGVLRLGAKRALPERLFLLRTQFEALIQGYKPDVVAMESVFFAKNVRSALILAHARGTILSTLWHENLEFCEFAPRSVKQAVVGSGKADKNQVAWMMQKHLQLKDLPQPLDASDALAVAWTYFSNRSIQL
jgi:crossover junction endodeoxyribonuclease RuvC